MTKTRETIDKMSSGVHVKTDETETCPGVGRRRFLKGVFALGGGAAVCPAMTGGGLFAAPAPGTDGDDQLDYPVKDLGCKTSRQITVALMGAGQRGQVYVRYAERYPDVMKVVAVSDVNAHRREKVAAKHGIPADKRFGDFHEMLAAGRLADAMIISLPDDLHYEPAMAAMSQGYDLLLEKPMAQREQECLDMLKRQRETGAIVGVCHVLRYAPYFQALKSAIADGLVGDVVSVQHMEPIEYAHMAHSYVRGNWHSSKETTPIILAKSCHDLDIVKWLVGRRCERVSAEGSLGLFRAENAPAGAPARCTDGCPHEATCPWSAIDIYGRRRAHMYVFDLPEGYTRDDVMEKLRTTPYGRCVFRCDNDQCDHYVATMLFDGGVTATLSMEAFTPWGGRRTRIMGTKGFIEGDGKRFNLWDFRSGKRRAWAKNVAEIAEYKGSGHGGGDLALVRDFMLAVDKRDESLLSSSLAASVESHVMGFACEKSRLGSEKVAVNVS